MEGRASEHWYLRPLVALALLTVEYLAISLVFDARQLATGNAALARLSWVGLAGPSIVAFGTALWMLGGSQIRQALRTIPSMPTSRIWARIAIHLGCFVLFFLMTALLFSGGEPPPGSPYVWASLWALTGLLNVGSLIPIAFGTRRLIRLIRELATPLMMATLLGFLAMGAGLTTLSLWRQLNAITLNSVASILSWLVSPIYFEPEKLSVGTPEFWVHVAPICSGYEGIGLIVVFLSAYLAVFHKRLRFPNVLVVLPVAVVLVWVFNVLRIVALILLGHFWSPEIAIGGFHSKAGWLVFCAVALGATWLTQRVPWFAAEGRQRSLSAQNPSAPFLLPLLALIATALVTGLFIGGFDQFYPVRVVVTLLVLAWYRDDYRDGLRQHLAGRRLLSWHAVGLGVLVYVLWVGISMVTLPELGADPPSELETFGPPLAFAWVVARALGAIVTVPIAEELAFRGFLLRRLVASDFTKVRYDQWHWPAVLISSIAFAALHQQWIGGFIAGLVYAYAQKRRGLLSDAIVAHAVTNALIAIEVLTLGHWALW
jgi:exosortase E/protease (VPEID-CTERM system)